MVIKSSNNGVSDCYRKIDHFFGQKRQELDRLVEQKATKQREELSRRAIEGEPKFIREQETTRQYIDSIILTIHHQKEQMTKMEETCLTITTRPLRIDDTLDSISQMAN